MVQRCDVMLICVESRTEIVSRLRRAIDMSDGGNEREFQSSVLKALVAVIVAITCCKPWDLLYL